MKEELSAALGHLRQAAHQLLRDPDPTGRALRLATQVLDLGEMLGEADVEPAYASGTSSAARSLLAASGILAEVPHLVPPEVWPALQVLLSEVGDDGHR